MREIAGRHFEYEYRNSHTDSEWVRTDFEPPLPETRCEAEKRLEVEVRGWIRGTALRWVLVTVNTECGVPQKAPLGRSQSKAS
jgi:hypothetical protein